MLSFIAFIRRLLDMEHQVLLSFNAGIHHFLDMAEAAVTSEPVKKEQSTTPTVSGNDDNEPLAPPDPEFPIISRWIQVQKRNLRNKHPKYDMALSVSEELFGVYRRNVRGWGHVGVFL
jgi:hypothetical protein